MSAIPLPHVPRFPVEEGHVKLFARALGDDNPIYRDRDHAARSPLGGIIAPPTFTEAGNHFDENWPYRPRFGQPWFGSGATPSGAPRPGGDSGTAMHAETHFTYHKPLRVGTVLSASARDGRRWDKQGPRSGRLSFSETVLTFVDETGTPVVDCTTVVLETERVVDSVGVGSGAQRGKAKPWPRVAVTRLDPAQWSAGRSVEATLVENLTRGQIIQYAGAAGDFSPQHTDEVYNTQVAGYPGIFAHGMLTMGMLGRALTDWVGDGVLRTFGFQFRRQVWPGDSLFARLEITAVAEQGTATFALGVENQHGETVGKGYATAFAGG
jgi:acyl dehydratase